MKARLYSLLKQIIIFLFIGVLYYLVITLSDYKLGFKCPLFEITGLKCPSCGVSRMIVSLVHLDFKEAFICNSALFILLPVYLGIFIHYGVTFVKTGKKEISTPSTILLAISVVVLIVYGVLRNIV